MERRHDIQFRQYQHLAVPCAELGRKETNLDPSQTNFDDRQQWTDGRQERISSLAQDVWNVSLLSGSKKKSATVDSEALSLVDGMGLEPTTPTLRTWCSPS